MGLAKEKRLYFLILTRGAQGELAISAGDSKKFGWNENELSVAQWAMDKMQMAGACSDTLSGATGLYFPLKGIRSTVDALAVCPKDKNFWRDPEQLQLLETFAAEIGGALESTRLSEAAGRAKMQTELQAIAQPAAGSARLRLGDFLTENRILILPPSLPKEEIIQTLIDRLDLPNRAQAFQAIAER